MHKVKSGLIFASFLAASFLGLNASALTLDEVNSPSELDQYASQIEGNKLKSEHAAADANQLTYEFTFDEQYQPSLKEDHDLAVENLLIKEIQLHDHADRYNRSDSTDAIGITGSVYNSSATGSEFVLRARYYDKDGSFMLETRTVHYAPAQKTVKFVSMHEASEFRNYGYAYDENDDEKVRLPYRVELGVMDVSPRLNNVGLISGYYEDFYYQNYDVNIAISEQERLSIEERSNAHFLQSRHGIVRHIPYRYETDLGDRRRVNIENISVNQNFNTKRDTYKRNLDLRIGDPNHTVIGDVPYEIKYDYAIDKNRRGEDSFYFNIFEEEHMVVNSNFQIEFPKPFDISRIGFTSGHYGSKNNKIIYYVDGNKIIGYLSEPMRSGNITVRVALGDHYFNNAGIHREGEGFFSAISIILPIIFCVVVIIIWSRYGREPKLIEPVEFYPPNGLNSLDVQRIYQGVPSSDGIISLLTYLASKGYIKIDYKKKGKGVFSQDDYTIVKVKDYDGVNPSERMFMNGLFKGAANEVTKSALEGKFYTTFDRIKNTEAKKKVFDSNGKYKIIAALLTAGIVLVPLFCLCQVTYNEFSDIAECLLPMVIVGIFMSPFILAFKSAAKESPATGIIMGFILAIFIVPVLLGTVNDISDVVDLIEVPGLMRAALFAMPLEVVIAIACICVMPRRKEELVALSGRIGGFRNFIMTAEKSRLEQITAENADYFYEILPYAYALGVSDKWMKRFEGIAVPPADWGTNDMDYHSLCNFVSHDISKISRDLSYDPTSSSSGGSSSGGGSSGGSSGGGSSGGGGGGGGSSSW